MTSLLNRSVSISAGPSVPTCSAPSSAFPSSLVSLTFDDPAADVTLRSCDGIHFNLRRAQLIANSGLFEDLFVVGSSSSSLSRGGGNGGSEAMHADLPTIDVEETAEEMDLFLRFICRRCVQSRLNISQIKILLRLSDKYDADIMMGYIDLSLCEAAEKSSALVVLALAIIYQRPEVATFAIPHLGNGHGNDLHTLPDDLFDMLCTNHPKEVKRYLGLHKRNRTEQFASWSALARDW